MRVFEIERTPRRYVNGDTVKDEQNALKHRSSSDFLTSQVLTHLFYTPIVIQSSPNHIQPPTMRALLRTGDRKELTYTSSYKLAMTKDDLACYMVHVDSCSLTRGELSWPEPLEQATPIPGYDLAGTIRT